MQTTQITRQDIKRWKKIFAEYRPHLAPNRISGEALAAYLSSRYPVRPLDDPRAKRVVTDNIRANENLAQQLPKGCAPNPVCFIVERSGAGEALYCAQSAVFAGIDIFVGIDLVSGYFFVEGSSLLWDELYAHRGLNETDLENFYSVAEYIQCLKCFNMLDGVLQKESL